MHDTVKREMLQMQMQKKTQASRADGVGTVKHTVPARQATPVKKMQHCNFQCHKTDQHKQVAAECLWTSLPSEPDSQTDPGSVIHPLIPDSSTDSDRSNVGESVTGWQNSSEEEENTPTLLLLQVKCDVHTVELEQS